MYQAVKLIKDELDDLFKERGKAEAQLRESKGKYHSLVEATSDRVWEVDRNCVYTYSNPKVKELLGYDPEEIIGKTPNDFMLPSDADQLKDSRPIHSSCWHMHVAVNIRPNA